MMPEEQRESQQDLDLWKQAFAAVGTEGDQQLHLFSEYSWSFSNLEDAFAEGGVLHGEKVFVFTCTEPQLLSFHGRSRATCIPVVVAVVSPFPPSDKIGIFSADSEEILDMENMNMGWIPHIPPGERGSSAESLVPQIYILSRVQREAASEHFGLDPNFQYCLPYFNNPFMVDEAEQTSVVDILYPTETGPIVYEFDWEFDEPEEFTNELIAAEELSTDHKDAFKEFVEEKVLQGQRAYHEAMQKQIQAQDELRAEDKVAAFEKMRFYKFYPDATPDTPDVSRAKSAYINRYYGKAHQVF